MVLELPFNYPGGRVVRVAGKDRCGPGVDIGGVGLLVAEDAAQLVAGHLCLDEVGRSGVSEDVRR